MRSEVGGRVVSRGHLRPQDIPTKRQPDSHTSTFTQTRGAASVAKSQQHPEGRQCRKCARRLSIYNPEQWCSPCFATIPVDARPAIRHHA